MTASPHAVNPCSESHGVFFPAGLSKIVKKKKENNNIMFLSDSAIYTRNDNPYIQ